MVTTAKYTTGDGILHLRDSTYSPADGVSMWERCPGLAASLDPTAFWHFYDECYKLDTTIWTSVDDAGTGTNTVNGVHGGEVSIVTAASDNDYHVMKSVAQSFKFQAAKPLWAECRFSVTEANTDDSNWVFGFTSDVTGGFLQDNGAGTLSNYSGAVIYKVDGTMTFKFQTSNATTQNSTANAGTFVSATTYRVGMFFHPGDGTTGTVTPYIDGVAGTALNITLASLAAMNLVYGIKAGGNNAETMKVDYIRAVGVR